MGKEFNLRINLEVASDRGDLMALKILEEGKNPGKFFDGVTQFNDVIKAIRGYKECSEVNAVGMFGSRAKGTHKPLRSDIDLVVIGNDEMWWRNLYRKGICDELHIQHCSIDEWNDAVKDEDNLKTANSVRWIWVRKGTALEIRDNLPQFNVKI